MSYKKTALSVTVILLLLISSSITTAKVTTVKKGGYSFARYDPEKGDEIHYEFEVLSGPKIDVLVMNKTNFDKYKNLTAFDYYEEFSILNAGSGQKTFEAPKKEALFIVMDGGAAGEADPEEDSTVEMKSVRTPKGAVQEDEGMNLPDNWWLYILIPVVLIVLILLWLKGEKGEDKEEKEESLRRR